MVTAEFRFYGETIMAYTVKKVEVWAGDILNRPGTLARVLESLSNAGAQLEFMIARRVNPDTSRVFLAPLKGTKQQRAAADVGVVRAAGLHALRIDGPDRPGLGAHITRALADKGINIRGASAASLGKKLVVYLAFETPEAVTQAASVLRKAL